MMTLKIKNVDYEFIIGNGEIYNIQILNPSYLYKFILSLRHLDEDFMFLYEKNLLDFSKHIVFIENVLNLQINNKKQITNLYQQIEKENINDDYRQKLAEINELVGQLMLDLSINSNIKLQYESLLDFKTLFSSIDLEYYENEDNFLENFLTYIKIVKEFGKINLIFTLNLFDYLNEQEIEKLKTELSFFHLSVINLGNSKQSIDKNIIIDEDLCQLT